MLSDTRYLTANTGSFTSQIMDLLFRNRLSYLKMLVFPFLLFCVVDVDSMRLKNRVGLDKPFKRSGRKEVIAERPPKIKMLKSLTRYFIQGHRAKVTLIFHASRPVHIRWYKKEESETLLGSEVPGFMPLQGDPKYVASYIKAGDVIAYTLSIPNFQERELPIVFETVISMVDGTMQYNLRTPIFSSHSRILTEIDSPEWDVYPANETHFKVENNWTFVCKAFVPHELDRTNINSFNELELNRFDVNFNTDPRDNMFTVARLIGDSDPWNETHIVEQSGDDPLYIMTTRRPLREHATYEIRLTTSNATSDLAGVYQCAMKRQPATSYIDLSYVLGTVLTETSPTADSVPTQASMIPCDVEHYDVGRRTLSMEPRKPTCLRCRGRGQPNVLLYHEGRPVEGNDVFVLEYSNVRDAGIREVTYVFRNPRGHINGKYECKVKSHDGAQSASSVFSITVL